MTAVLSVALLFATPVAPSHATWMGVEPVEPAAVEGTVARLDQQPIWKDLTIWGRSPSDAAIVGAEATIWLTDSLMFSDPVPPPVLSVPIEPPALLVEASVEITPPSPPPAPPVTLRDRALGRLAELGATPWMIATFDCIGFRESTWRNVASTTGDVGVFQINQVHNAELWRRGLDPWVPEDAATYAWSLSRWGTTFKPWSVHALCGV